MRAIVQDVYGGPEVLRLRDDVPEPGVTGEKDVLVRVHAAGMDQSVWHLVTGTPLPARLMFGLRTPRTPIRGWDVAGHVEQVGPGVTRFEPGDAVFGSGDGAFAEYGVFEEDRLAPVPAGLELARAAALATSGLTALQALRTAARLSAGQRVLITGAGGGVGSFAVQIATADGAHVTGVCSTSKVDFVRSLGADEVVDYTRQDVTAVDLPADQRFDVVVDTAGHRPLARLRRILTPGGTLVIVGSEVPGVTGGLGRSLKAVALSPFVAQTFRVPLVTSNPGDLETLRHLVETGAVSPAVSRTYPLAEVPQAIRDMRAAAILGKAVVLVEEG